MAKKASASTKKRTVTKKKKTTAKKKKSTYSLKGSIDWHKKLMGHTAAELKSWAKQKGITGYSKMNKEDLVAALMKHWHQHHKMK